MGKRRLITPFTIPVLAFATAILAGALALSLTTVEAARDTSFIDHLLTSTSAVCVTGLAAIDPSTTYTTAGHVIILFLIQVGGIGIVTYAALILFLLNQRVSMGDRIALEQTFFQDPKAHIGAFLKRIVLLILGLEIIGALCFYLFQPDELGFFHSIFLSVSSFCNAGFAPWPGSAAQWQNSWGMSLTIIVLVELGSLGFFVIDELLRLLWAKIRGVPPRPYYYQVRNPHRAPKLSFQAKVIITTTTTLFIVGTVSFWLISMSNPMWKDTPWHQLLLGAMFESASFRTVGFAPVNLRLLSDLSLMITILLMIIGGSPGSCGGGIRTTTLRTLIGYMKALIYGKPQVYVQGKPVDSQTVNKAMQVFFFSVLMIVLTTLALMITENGAMHHGATRFEFLDLLFEAVAAYSTVGLSLDVTPQLTAPGKIVLCLAMFIGRLGPLWLITTLQQLHTKTRYRQTAVSLPIG